MSVEQEVADLRHNTTAGATGLHVAALHWGTDLYPALEPGSESFYTYLLVPDTVTQSA